MNRIKTLMAAVAAAFICAACVKDEPVVIEYLDVNANNISGSWELVEWNGAPLQQGQYLYDISECGQLLRYASYRYR